MYRPFTLPPSQDPSLHLVHPTPAEFKKVYSLSFHSWGDALTLPQYLQESAYLTTVPLAKDGGMKVWILTDRTLRPDERPILSSCETFRKRAFVKQTDGSFSETIIYGIASVYCDPEYRRRRYAARLMSELAAMLLAWSGDTNKCSGSILYSDIGKTYYAKLGWHPFPINDHVELEPSISPWPSRVDRLRAEDLGTLCAIDVARVRRDMIKNPNKKTQMIIVPDLDHMMWHIGKEDFACHTLFGKCPETKGAIARDPGSQVWAIWTHRYYGTPGNPDADNTLYILRMVIDTADSGPNLEELRATQIQNVLQAAQVEAAEWKLDSVKLWNPPLFVREAVKQLSPQHRIIERVEDGIGSLLWLGEGNGREDSLEWISGEHYAWL